ncbi:SDR family oxidoreductase [Anianabacter salinae]|uniref:SDR family oxidoreductase n=1 Tax=Anianabacter salinae TaxID=2851023 RepID=UPI00225E3B69|nr:SDR family oxidoreductase [Anianabacter salinae]MBV0910985.1 SDR family oxidoreductase [Anianabacter salinae]
MTQARALIIGSTGGIGSALFAELERRLGAGNVVGLSRSGHGLDITREPSVEAVMNRLEGEFDLIFVATGALQIDGQQPEKALKHITERAMRDQFEVNALGPALLLKHGVRLLPRDRRAVFAVMSARVGSIGDNGKGGWYGYRTAKAAVNQIVHTAAIELGRTHKRAICVAMHPGTVATSFTRDFVSPDNATPPEQAARNLLDVLDGLTLDQSGGFYDYAGKPIPW